MTNNDNVIDTEFMEVLPDGEDAEKKPEVVDVTNGKEVADTPDSSNQGNPASQDSKTGDKNPDEYEKVCYICRRPESVAGKMIEIPGGLSVCPDCMQKTFDSMSRIPFGGDNSGNNIDLGNLPQFSFLNLQDLMNGFVTPDSQKLKKKKPKAANENAVKSEIDIDHMLPPHEIKAKLDEYVIGQEHAKKVISVAVYNHYKQVKANENLIKDQNDGVEIEKSNVLMIGPTGSGKTYLVKTLAKLLDVPLAITDATSLTEAGYIGDDIESVVSKLLAAAGNDVEKAEKGIIFIDEIDKLAKKRNANQRDVSGEAVQQGMLKLLEGSEIEVPVGASSKNAMVPMTMVDTTNILFICGGAFPDLEDIIKERLNKSSAMGFVSDLKDKYDDDKDILSKVSVEDLRKFGMIPEFLGRLPVICTLEPLSTEMMVKILKEPKNAIVKQYQKLFAYDEVNLQFDDDALISIAEKAKERELGARALRSILEELMLDIMYEIPKDDDIGTVIVTKDYVEHKGGPKVLMRTDERRKAIAG